METSTPMRTAAEACRRAKALIIDLPKPDARAQEYVEEAAGFLECAADWYDAHAEMVGEPK